MYTIKIKTILLKDNKYAINEMYVPKSKSINVSDIGDNHVLISLIIQMERSM